MKNPVPFLRKIALIEAVSYLVLLGIAMPLKYLADMPLAVRIVGSVHGLLFVIFGVALLRTMWVARWPMGRGALVFVASLIPVATFVIDPKMKGYIEEFRRGRG
jgi:integral membrane protein